MRFLVASGIVQVPTTEDLAEHPAAWERLVVECWRFLRAGGAIDLDAWGSLCDVEKAALAEARRRRDAETAALAGRAAQSLEDAAAVAAPADGGESEKRIALQRATQSAILAAMQEPAAPAGDRP